MTQAGRRIFLIGYLLREGDRLKKTELQIPAGDAEQRHLLRSLMNIRPAGPVSEEFLAVQDACLQQELAEKGVVSLQDLPLAEPGIRLWQGDITRLSVDGIVNAANSALLGCFVPCHGCIDNAIHSAAGVQLRLECSRIMERQNMPEPTGRAKVTGAYNLPCRYVLHTVGPIVYGAVTEKDRMLLAQCYHSCLELAAAYQMKSIAFCCISTGEFHFPGKEAAAIAIETVRSFLKENPNSPEVVFNVFKDSDYEIYRQQLKSV